MLKALDDRDWLQARALLGDDITQCESPALMLLWRMARRITPAHFPHTPTDTELLVLLKSKVKKQQFLITSVEPPSTQSAAYQMLLGGWATHIESDKSKAVKHYQIAADLGHPAGQFSLAVCLEWGDGCDVDLVESERLYHLAAEQGQHVEAMYVIGSMFAKRNNNDDGNGTFNKRKDMSEASSGGREQQREGVWMPCAIWGIAVLKVMGVLWT